MTKKTILFFLLLISQSFVQTMEFFRDYNLTAYIYKLNYFKSPNLDILNASKRFRNEIKDMQVNFNISITDRGVRNSLFQSDSEMRPETIKEFAINTLACLRNRSEIEQNKNRQDQFGLISSSNLTIYKQEKGAINHFKGYYVLQLPKNRQEAIFPNQSSNRNVLVEIKLDGTIKGNISKDELQELIEERVLQELAGDITIEE
jgi:hypothetical protein